MKKNRLTVQQYAASVGKTRQAVMYWINNGLLPEGVRAEKIGRDWFVFVPVKEAA